MARAQVVLLRDDHVLLARHERGDHSYWVLPGGAIEEGETPEQAAVRELWEETGLEIQLVRLLFVDGPRQTPGVEIRQPRHTYLGRIIGADSLTICNEVVLDSVRDRLVGVAWMPFDAPELDTSTCDTLDLVKRALFHQSPASPQERAGESAQ